MGSGSSRKVTRQTQFPSPSRKRAPSPPPSPIIYSRPVSNKRRPHSPQPPSRLKETNIQRQLSNSHLAKYASVWEQNGKLSSTFQQLIQSGSIKIEHEQKETQHQHLETKHSSAFGSAQVESTLISDVESIHHLKTSEKLDALMLNLKQTHLEFDETVKRRTGQVTLETESILVQIVEETQQSQQQLLIQAKEQQTIQDEQYRILLQEFITQLDIKRAKQLSLIQEQLQQQRLEIFNESQLKIRAVSEQSTNLKNYIMSEEERKASQKIDSIVTEINTITTESAIHHLGSEITTKIDLTIHETVGFTSPEQFQVDSDDQINNRLKQQQIKRTIFIPNISSNDKTSGRPTSSHFADQQNKTTSKLVSQNPANPSNPNKKS